jgi:hypothetical protein
MLIIFSKHHCRRNHGINKLYCYMLCEFLLTSLSLNYDLINATTFKTTEWFEVSIIVVQKTEGSYRFHFPIKFFFNETLHSHYTVLSYVQIHVPLCNEYIHLVNLKTMLYIKLMLLLNSYTNLSIFSLLLRD